MTVVANLAMIVGAFALAPSPAEAAAHPNAFWPNTIAVFLLAPLTGAAFLLAVVLTMEYRVRSRGSAEPNRKRRLKQLVLLLTPTALQIAALVVLVVIALAW